MLYLELYWVFVKIGFCSFGGLSMVPLISREMLAHGWLTAHQVSDIVAIAEMTPGSLGINCATFAGIHAGGTLGSICATLGVMTPSLTLCLVAAYFLSRFRDNRTIAHALTGIRPVCFGMVVATGVSLAMENYVSTAAVAWAPVLIGAVVLVLLAKFKLSIPLCICISAVLGILLVR